MKKDDPENTKQATTKEATQSTFADAVTATAQRGDDQPPAVVETPEEQRAAGAVPPPIDEAERARREEERRKVAAGYGLTDQEYAVLLKTTCKDAPREIAAWFMLFCKHRGLDPFSKQVYLWNDKYEDRNVAAEGGGMTTVKVPVGQWQVVTGIDGLRVIASRSPYYRGQLRPIWTYAPDPEQRDAIARFEKSESQYGKIAGKRRVEECEVIVRRAIPQAPTDSSLYLEFCGIARFDEFVKLNFNGKIYGNWEVQPEHQTRIRAEAQGLRMAFPEEVGGIYLEDELRDRVEQTVDGGQPGGQLSVATTLEYDPKDTEIDRLRRALGWTAAKVRLEGDKYGGGKDGTVEMLTKALAEKTGAAPKGGTRGAEAPPAEPPSLEGAACFWTEEGEACKDTPTHFEFGGFPDGEKVPTCDYHTGAGVGPNGEPIVALARCTACGAKRGEEHGANCPREETNVPAEGAGQ